MNEPAAIPTTPSATAVARVQAPDNAIARQNSPVPGQPPVLHAPGTNFQRQSLKTLLDAPRHTHSSAMPTSETQQLSVRLHAAGFTGELDTQADLDQAMCFVLAQAGQWPQEPTSMRHPVLTLLDLGASIKACNDTEMRALLQLIAFARPAAQVSKLMINAALCSVSWNSAYAAGNRWLLQVLVDALTEALAATSSGAPSADGNIVLKRKLAEAALEEAAQRRHFKTVTALLAIPGIEVDRKGDTFSDWLVDAARAGKHLLVKGLVAAQGIRRKHHAFERALENRHFAVAACLLSAAGKNLPEFTETLRERLKAAARDGDLELLNFLLSEELPDFDAAFDKALSIATKERHLDIVNALVAAPRFNNRMSAAGARALVTALEKWHSNDAYIDIALVLARSAGIDAESASAFLEEAIDTERPELLKALLAVPGVEVNRVAEEENGLGISYVSSPLRRAVARADAAMLSLLLAQASIDVNAQWRDRHDESDEEDRDEYVGESALQIAAADGSDEIISMLLKRPELNLNARNQYGMTALMLAANAGHRRTVEMLLAEPGIIVRTRSQRGETALSLAREKGHTEIVALISVRLHCMHPAREHQAPHMLPAADEESGTAHFSSAVASACGSKRAAPDSGFGDSGRSMQEQMPRSAILRLALDLRAFGHEGSLSGWDSIDETLAWLAGKHDCDDRLAALRTSKIAALLDLGADVNARDEEGMSPLHHAAVAGDITLARSLLQHPGIDINAQDDDYCTPLILAARNGHAALAQCLLEHAEIDVNARESKDWSALQHAAARGHREVMVALLAIPRIDPNAQNAGCDGGKDISALHWAATAGDLAIMQALLALACIQVNVLDHEACSALHLAASRGHGDIISILLSAPGIEVNQCNAHGQTPLHCAVEQGWPAALRLLLADARIEVNIRDALKRTALVLACKAGNARIVDLLLADERVDPNIADAREMTPLHLLVSGEQYAILGQLAQHAKLEPNARNSAGETALWIATNKEDLRCMKLLLATPGVDPNIGDHPDVKPLHLACVKGFANGVHELLAAPQIDVNARIHKRETALGIAISMEMQEIISALLAVPGIDANLPHRGATPIEMALARRDVALLDALLAVPGIDVLRGREGRPSALHLATRHGDVEMLRRLLAAAQGHHALPDCALEAISHAVASEKGDMVEIVLPCAHDVIELLLDHARAAGGFAHGIENVLRRAAHYGLVDIAARLVVEVPLTSINGTLSRPGLLHQAIFDGDFRLLKALLTSSGTQVNMRDNEGRTALILAVRRRQERLMKILLGAPDIDVNAKDHAGNTALKHADASLMPGLLAAGADAHRASHHFQRQHSLRETLRSRETLHDPSVSLLSICVHPSIPIQDTPPFPLQQICRDLIRGRQREEAVFEWLTTATRLPDTHRKALARAFALGSVMNRWGPRNFLAATGKLPDAPRKPDQLPHIIPALEQTGMLATFQEAGKAFDWLKGHLDRFLPDGQTLLTHAAQAGDLDMIDVLLALGANIHLPADDGDNAILAAAKAGQWAAYIELVSRGARPNTSDRAGYPSTFYLLRAFTSAEENEAPNLARLIRYLIRRGHSFDRMVPAPESQPSEAPRMMPLHEMLHAGPQQLALYGKILFGIEEENVEIRTDAAPASGNARIDPPAQAIKTADIEELFAGADPTAAVRAWLDADAQRLYWRDPETGQSLLHLAVARQQLETTRLLLVRGINRQLADHNGCSAMQLLPADYMSSYTPAARQISALLQQ